MTVIVHHQRLRDALALVIAAAKADRVHVTEVVLGLGMDKRIAVNFACRGLKNTRLDPFRHPEHIDRAHHARFDSLYGIVLIMDR